MLIALLLSSLLAQASTEPIELSCTLELEVQPMRAVGVENERERRFSAGEVLAMLHEDDREYLGLETTESEFAFLLTVAPESGDGRIRFERDFDNTYYAGESAWVSAEVLPDRIAVDLSADDPLTISRRNGRISGAFQLDLVPGGVVDDEQEATVAAGGSCERITAEDRIF